MFDKLLNLLFQATTVQPKYNAEHCLVVTKAVGGCKVCADTCPHNAITIKRQVEIDDIDCTGCGLCVQACPSQALESSVTYQPGAPLKCSQVSGSAQTVQCLARLQPSDILRLASKKDKVTLVRNECEGCKIGAAAVKESVADLIVEAKTLAALRGRELEAHILVTESYDTTDNPDPVSRRDLLRGGWRGAQRSAADVLAPLEVLNAAEEAEKGLPTELKKSYGLIAATQPEPDTSVPWVLPRVAEGCIMCPVCTNVCPTGAFHRELEPVQVGGGVLKLEPERCNGCNACVTSCPVRVISLEDEVTWTELSGGTQEVYKKASGAQAGTVSRSPRSSKAPHIPLKEPDDT